MLTKHFDVKD